MRNIKIIIPVACFIFLGFACVDSGLLPGYKCNTTFQINVGAVGAVYLDDIAYYDKSSNIFYLNNIHNICYNKNLIDFWITSGEELILKGYYNYQCTNCDTALVFLSNGWDWNFPELLRLCQTQTCGLYCFESEDLLENIQMEQVLNNYGKLVQGLQISYKSVELNNPGNVVMILEIYNPDSVGYYYPDVAKMGLEYYGGLNQRQGLTLYSTDTTFFYNHLTLQRYSDSTYWEESWLTLIKSGETRTMLFDYNNFDAVSPGSYCAFFKFQGLAYQINSYDEMQLDSGNIWLGSIDLISEIELN